LVTRQMQRKPCTAYGTPRLLVSCYSTLTNAMCVYDERCAGQRRLREGSEYGERKGRPAANASVVCISTRQCLLYR
jgi:hypothetical protein